MGVDEQIFKKKYIDYFNFCEVCGQNKAGYYLFTKLKWGGLEIKVCSECLGNIRFELKTLEGSLLRITTLN